MTGLTLDLSGWDLGCRTEHWACPGDFKDYTETSLSQNTSNKIPIYLVIGFYI